MPDMESHSAFQYTAAGPILLKTVTSMVSAASLAQLKTRERLLVSLKTRVSAEWPRNNPIGDRQFEHFASSHCASFPYDEAT